MADLWIDTRLSDEEMDFLNQTILESKGISYKPSLAGNISKSEVIIDKDNWFYETTLKKLVEKMFYNDWNNYSKYVVDQEEPPPEFELYNLWVNYQKQHEFNPLHKHGGLFSFVIFMKIPTHWKEQHALPFSANSGSPSASDFEFVWTEKDTDYVISTAFPLSPEDEGRMLFFPAWLRHQVYPFYGTEKERVTISGNIDLYDPSERIPKSNKSNRGGVYEEKENILTLLENNVKILKEELKMVKKAGENEQ